MAVLRFLQVSDVHLGRPFGWLDAEHRLERRKDQREALSLVVTQAIERAAHAILIPGDLFDQEGVDAESLAFALHAFDVAGCPPVLIAPGNHDPWFDASPYWSPRMLNARGFAWPDHVHVFSTPAWSAKALPNLADVRVWGRCYTPRMASVERPLVPEALQAVGPPAPGGIEIAVFHGSRENRCPPGQQVVAPFSDEEVRSTPFAYIAVGHYHAASRIESHDAGAGGVQLAYAGSAVALDPTELGKHGALEVTIEFGPGRHHVAVEEVELDLRNVLDVVADVTGCSSAEEVDRRALKALDEAKIDAFDIATVRLRGRLVKGVRYSGPGGSLAARAFHVRTDLRGVRPDYDLAAYRNAEASTTEERFAKVLLERLDGANDPDERTTIESALYYGLDAFRLREVVPAYEDFGP
ncbi:MAG: hypothetical protein A2W00_02165 [Candidatus Eisenbacteria bacterium RBG_16_71_46]|nr:MAG: hypothetical protein A2W00_02165 [Candidatus Eisenbacteria bacterium RBG_16_71_46]OGF23593.1 MAG: hypothetical protein A2V63_00280 [Candidatus Eisenbacteria bacterium RBG_19FT_COMBO_70_11]